MVSLHALFVGFLIALGIGLLIGIASATRAKAFGRLVGRLLVAGGAVQPARAVVPAPAEGSLP